MSEVISLSILDAVSPVDAIKQAGQYIDPHTPCNALQGQTEGIQHDAYNGRINKCFKDAHTFLTAHAHARTDNDWDLLITDMKRYTDPLTAGLISECVNELEREYKAANDNC